MDFFMLWFSYDVLFSQKVYLKKKVYLIKNEVQEERYIIPENHQFIKTC